MCLILKKNCLNLFSIFFVQICLPAIGQQKYSHFTPITKNNQILNGFFDNKKN